MAPSGITAKADHGQRMATFQRNGSRETKRSLVRAAVALWRVQGYDDTTIADICRAAGVSKGLFYFYFERKEDLLFEVGALSSASLIRVADARLTAGAQLGEVIRGVVGALEQAMRRNPPVLIMESVIEGYRRERAVREAVENSPDQSLRVFSKVFARAVADGQLPPGFEIDRVALLAQTVLSAAARHWASGLYEDRSFEDEVVADLELLVAGGVLKAGGRPLQPGHFLLGAQPYESSERSPMSMQNIAVIGAGRMGRPMVDRLVAAGYAPAVHARRPQTQAAAEAAGLRWAGSIAETVRDADLVLTVVFDEAQLRSVTLGPDGALAAMKQGSILVQHTTCDPAVVTDIADAAKGYGIEVLDAAVSGTPRDIAAGQLTVWAGGPEATLDSARAALGAYASPVLSVGPVGHGQRVKLVNNALFVAQVGLAVEAVRIAAGVGLCEADVLAALQHGSGASRALSAVAWIGADNVGSRLSEFMIKDVDAVRVIAGRAQVDLGLLGDVLDSAAVREGVLNGGIAADRDLAARSRAEPGSIKSEP